MKSTSGQILLVEDDADVREAIQDALEGEGYVIATAINGKDGLERLRQMERPRVILLDLMMPVMSGSEFLVEVRKEPSLATIPVLVVSAWPNEAAQIEPQVHGYVKKPIALEVLLEALAPFFSDDAGEERHA